MGKHYFFVSTVIAVFYLFNLGKSPQSYLSKVTIIKSMGIRYE